MFFKYKQYFWWSQIPYTITHVIDSLVLIFTLGFYGSNFNTWYIIKESKLETLKKLRKFNINK